MPIQLVLATNPVISILESRTRAETMGQMGGGTMIQTFVWTEKIDTCNWHFMWVMNDPELLDVQPWSDYERYTEDPLEDMPR